VVVRFRQQGIRNHFIKKFKVAGYRDLSPAYSKSSNEWLIYLVRYIFEMAYKRYLVATLGPEVSNSPVISRGFVFMC
jgi:hypothetical protein